MRVIVTGAARGIGAAICERVASACRKDGRAARIIASDLDGDQLAATAARLRDLYDAEVIACPGSIGEIDAPAGLVERAQSAFGGIDTVYSNVGRSMKGPVLGASIADWDDMFAINVRAPWLLAAAAAPLLEQSQGSIVITASITASHPAPFGPYSITKAALVMLMKQLSVELGGRGIRINSIAPSMVYTAATAELYANPEVVKRKNAAVPLGRISQPDEIADVAFFLASPAARYVSGIDLRVDGGFGNTLMYLTQGGTGLLKD
jgi:glucose 1-dehydrogenase